VSKLPLSSDAARHKFRVLAGQRWDSVKDTVKISCERFPSQKMNEKWCSDTIVKLLAESEVCQTIFLSSHLFFSSTIVF
jgi:small subunit ribosomal protein S35